MQRVLVGSPIRQTSPILQAFLTSLLELETDSLAVDFAFVDDNDEAAASDMLRAFSPTGQVHFVPGEPRDAPYQRDEQTHHWDDERCWRVAVFKDRIIGLARQDGYDGLFLIDSDTVVHPQTLVQLIANDVDICAEIMWTSWKPDEPELPQVWLRDSYTMVRQRRGEVLSAEEANRRYEEFLAQLRQSGVYEVGGLAACTLFRRRALDLGVCFREIPNLGLMGEDRHLCIRAAAVGLKLHIDTHYPALHLYRASDLDRVAGFKASFGPPVTLFPGSVADSGFSPG